MALDVECWNIWKGTCMKAILCLGETLSFNANLTSFHQSNRAINAETRHRRNNDFFVSTVHIALLCLSVKTRKRVVHCVSSAFPKQMAFHTAFRPVRPMSTVNVLLKIAAFAFLYQNVRKVAFGTHFIIFFSIFINTLVITVNTGWVCFLFMKVQ